MQTKFDKEAYELWYEFMKRSRRKNWSKPMKSCFSDIDRISFDQWWETVEGDIAPIAHPGVEKLTTAPECADYLEDEQGMVVWVNLHEPKIKIMHSLDLLIKDAMKSQSGSVPEKRKGRPKFVTRFNWLELPFSTVIREQNVIALRKMLAVYDLCVQEDEAKANGEAYKTRYEIGVASGIAPIHVIEENDLNAKDKRIKMNVSVSRCFKQAKDVIANAEKGIFPRHS